MAELPQSLELDADGVPLAINLVVRRRRGIRRLRLWVGEGELVILSAPWQLSRADGLAFLRSHAAWLAEQLAKRRQRPGLLDFVKHQGWVSLDGRRWRVVCDEGYQRTRLVADATASCLTVCVNAGRNSGEHLYREFRKTAGIWLVKRARDLAASVGAQPARLSVRDPRTRWGSCSSSGGISLSWRLIFLEEPMQDYVIFHELAHLQELNHSPAFWDLLASYDEYAGEHDRALKDCAARMNFDTSKA